MAAMAGDQDQQPPEHEPDRQAADVAKEKLCHRSVEKSKADYAAAQCETDDARPRRHDAENAEYGDRGGDRNDFRHGHPVEAVHEINEIDEPQAADDQRQALDPPRQQGNDAQFGR